jgi:hypothetical protein
VIHLLDGTATLSSCFQISAGISSAAEWISAKHRRKRNHEMNQWYPFTIYFGTFSCSAGWYMPIVNIYKLAMLHWELWHYGPQPSAMAFTRCCPNCDMFFWGSLFFKVLITHQ